MVGAEVPWVWLTGVLGPSLLAAAALMAAGGAALVGCCACCRKTPKGFQEFTDSGSSHSLSTGGCINPAAVASSPASEFAIFPPPSGGGVSFEPLPDIQPRQATPSRPSQKKPAAFNNAVSHGLSAQDWFDKPHGNFPRSQLKYLCEFGKGWFGRVVEGEAVGLASGCNGISPPTRVIVKILHGDATPTDQMYFLHEVRYLKDLTPHPNILQLKGRCLETDPFLIILEACPTGDLKTFLLQNLATSEALSLQGVILRMACNVAAGLQHMHEHGFVHTDLAARNCLVASDLTVKIGDYGTSIDNFKEDYYCADDVALPIRWCAPDTLHCTDTTIETKEVTTAANIWSFGVLLWEICEFGRLPYSELNDEEVIIKVLSEKSLHLGPPSRPCLQSNNLYHLMRMCWNSNHKRPGIAQVAAVLHNLFIHPDEIHSRSFEDFERHWDMMKPNGITAVVETIVHEPPMRILPKGEEERRVEPSSHRNLSPSPHPSLHGEPISPKHKSASLQNLRGSLEDLVESSRPLEADANQDTGVCELDAASCALERKGGASWLSGSEVQVEDDDDDAQFVRKISEAIRDLDDVLALEKTSSSSGTSPEDHSPTKKRFLQLSHEKIDENGVLDFRLGDKRSKASAKDESVDSVTSVKVPTASWAPVDNVEGEGGVPGLSSAPGARGVGEGGGAEAWRRVGEFSVREKWRSVQDLMVLTHIEESSGSEGSNPGSPPGAPSCGHPPSFGSVGDLRTAVLGEEFQRTLERLCAANKRSPFGLPACSVENFLEEELEEGRVRLESSEAARSSHEKCSPSPSVGPSSSEVCSGILCNEWLGEGAREGRQAQGYRGLPERCRNELTVESGKKLDSVITSTPILRRDSSVNEDSFVFERPIPPGNMQMECSAIRSDTLDSSVLNVEPTFPESDLFPRETYNKKTENLLLSEVPNKGNCDSLPVISNELNDNTSQYFSEVANEKPHFPSENVLLFQNDCSSSKVIETVKSPKAQYAKANIKISDSTSYSPLSHESGISVSPLSVLAKNCLSSFQHSQLDDKNGGTKILDKFEEPVGDISLSLSGIHENDGKDINQTLEISPQESPMTEFPGDLEEQSPIHGLTHDISGSQSTVECRSPLALSPVTVGIDNFNSSATSATHLSVSQQDLVLNDGPCGEKFKSDGSSPCGEKFKSDGVTKEINSDFIFSVDPSVENMDAVIKPDLLLDTEKANECVPFCASKLPSDLMGQSRINFQDNVVEALIHNIEGDKSMGSFAAPGVIGKGFESSHTILLDLVQIDSNKIRESTNSSNVLSGMNEPNKVTSSKGKENKNHVSPELLGDEKNINSVNEAQELLKKCHAEDKENNMSDLPNSEDCDSAGTEDSVFDFSPPAPDSKSDSTVSDCPPVKQRNGKSSESFGDGEQSGFGSPEMKELEVQRIEGRQEEEEELVGTKQWTPDDERSSDSGFRDKGSLSESVEDACEKCDLADVEGGGGEVDIGEVDMGRETGAEGGAVGVTGGHSANPSGVCEREVASGERAYQTSPPPCREGRSVDQEEFWRQQMASLRQAAGDTAMLIREASAPIEGRGLWVEGDAWEEDVMGSSEELKILSGGGDADRGLDEASLAALRSELQEKLGGNNHRFGTTVEGMGECGVYDRGGEERLSEDDEGEEVSEDRTDITIHYDAYLAQLSPILEERESVGSSEMYSPATKEPLRDSASDDSATTASVNDIGDNQVFLNESNMKDPVITAEDILVVDTATNQASFIGNDAIDFQENDAATSPEFSDSLEDDDNEDDAREKPGKDPLEDTAAAFGQDVRRAGSLSPGRCNVPPSNFWAGIHSWNGMAPSGGGSPPRSPLLLPPPPSSAPMPSPEEERAGGAEQSKKIPIFRDFEDIVALCHNQGGEFLSCNDVAAEGLRGERSSEETEVSGTSQNLPFWESESSDGNDSSSSGEFVWKEGERDAPHAIDASALEPVSRVYESLSEFPMAVIEEEDEDDTCDGDGERDDGASDSSGSIMEFIPSVWNSAAEPSHSSLRSPDRKSDQKKNVSFKRQKYHCVYEYPKEEASDSESECQDSPTRRRWDAPPFDYSSYADWELLEGDIPEGAIPSEMEVEPDIPNAASNQRQFDFYKLSSEDYDFGFGVSPDTSEGEFMVSSSSRPFQYCAPDPSFQGGSQFFPGLSANPVPPGWVGRRSSWSKGNEESSEHAEGEVESDVGVPQDPSHSGEGGSPSACSDSPPASPLSSGLGELRHTRDRLKLDLKFSASKVSPQGKERPPRKEGEVAEGIVVTGVDDEVKELKVRRRAAEQKGEASLLDAGKERASSDISKTAL